MLELDSPIYFLAMLGVGLVLGHWLAQRSRFFRETTLGNLSTTPGRHPQLEGLRGLLAMAVVVSHASASYVYQWQADWSPLDHWLYANAGRESVRLFLSLSSFLFWSTFVLDRRPLFPRAFLWQRVRRLFPAYAVACAGVFAVVALRNDFALRVPVPDLLVSVARWLTFGPPGFAYPNINGEALTLTANAGVFWSLQWEWTFYLLLPIAVVVAHRVGTMRLIAATAVGLCIARGLQALAVENLAAPSRLLWVSHIGANFLHRTMAFFGPGVLAAVLWKKFSGHTNWRAAMLSRPFAKVFFLGVTALLTSGHEAGCAILAFGVLTLALFAPLPIRMLSQSSSRVLGAMSYSIYLFHGLILTLYRLATASETQPPSPLVYWMRMAAVIVLVLGWSAVTYRFLEHPFLKKRAPPGDKTQSLPDGSRLAPEGLRPAA